MKSKNFLVFDIGASNGRSSIVKFFGNKFELEITYRFQNKPVYAAGTHYWDILCLYSEIKNGISKSVKEFKNLESMSIDTWAVDFGFLDKNGKLISNPIHYRDLKRNLIQKEFFKLIPEIELFKLTGGMLISIFSVYHMYSLKKQNSTELAMADKFLMIPDIFCYFLTGKIYNEFTNITTTTMYDQVSRRWSGKILEKIGISESIFAEIVQPGKVIGDISKDICMELGIRKFPVIASAYDAAAAEAGIPMVNNEKVTAFSTSGTWFNFGMETKKPLINENVFYSGYSNLGGVSDINQLTKNMTGLWIIQQCREKWILDSGRDISWQDIGLIYPKAKQFKSFIDVDDPIFGQVQFDMPRVIDDYCLKSGQKSVEDIGEISRCIYESLVLKSRYNFEMLEKLTGKKIEIIHLIGGGTQNKLFCQWLSDATGKMVVAGPVECTSYGNFLIQLLTSGEISNLQEGRELIMKSSEIINYYPNNKDEWDMAYERFLKII
jgi:rhamnulokinase